MADVIEQLTVRGEYLGYEGKELQAFFYISVE